MKKQIRLLLHHCKKTFIQTIKCAFALIPKDKRLIMFSAWFGQKYLDSPMYMYEYFLELGTYKVYWYTRNKDLYVSLLKQGKPVVYAYSLRGTWKQIRAIMLVSSVQLMDYSLYF